MLTQSKQPPLERERLDLWHSLNVEKVAEKAQSHMLAFTKWMNPNFKINWHHRIICHELDLFIAGKTPRLMLFVQPQTGKSELVSRHLPAFIFGKDPNHKIISSTYNNEFASLFNLDVQRIIDSDRYRMLFPNTQLAGGAEEGRWVRNSSTLDIVEHAGRYNSVGVKGSTTGKTANTFIIDDPVKDAADVESKTKRDSVARWFSTVARSRLKQLWNGSEPRILLTMTRWHEDDLAGRLLEMTQKNPGIPQWKVVRFPAMREDMEDPRDPRPLDGLLWPEMVSSSMMNEIKQTDARTWTSLYQQRPSPEEGDIFKRDWWKYYKELPADMDLYIQSWDLTFDEGPTNDFTVGQVWGKKGANRYLIAQIRARMGFIAQLNAVEQMTGAYPQAIGKYVEKAANGAALIATLKNKITGINAVKPLGSKPNRARAISPQVQAGNVWLPDPSIAPWILEFVEEHAAFPNVRNDDQVDTCSQALMVMIDARATDWTPLSIVGQSKWTGM